MLREVNHNGVAEDLGASVQVVDRNEVAPLAHHRQVAAHKGRIGADPADDKLTGVNPFYTPSGDNPLAFFRGFDSRLWYQLRDGCD